MEVCDLVLNIGMTFATLSCCGTIPWLKESVKICRKGLDRVRANLETKLTDKPNMSKVFFFCKEYIALNILHWANFLFKRTQRSCALSRSL